MKYGLLFFFSLFGVYTIGYICVPKSLDFLQTESMTGHFWRYQWHVWLWPCSQKVPECRSPCSFSWRCGYRHPRHTSTLSLACLQGHKVVGIALAASIPELGTLGSGRIIAEPDRPGLTGALITRQGAQIASGWRSG